MTNTTRKSGDASPKQILWVILNSLIVLQCYITLIAEAQSVSSRLQANFKQQTNSSNSKLDQQKVQTQGNQRAVVNNTIDEDQSSSELENFWFNQRDAFFNSTSFELSKATNELVGPEYGNQTYHLPYWFDYEMFMNVTDRSFNDSKVALKRHHIYVDNCVSIWRNNAFKRLHWPNNFTFIDNAEDWTQQENYNEEWNEISLNLTQAELREQPVAKGLRLVKEELADCTRKRDKNLCILLLVDLDERFGPSMKLRYPFEEERYRSLLDLDAAEEAAAEFADSLLSSDGRASYWLDRREQFFKNTTFALGAKTRKLVENFNSNKRQYHLPYWFDYEVFKRMVGRINETPQEELKSHHKYIDSCLEIWNDTAADRLGQLDYEAVPITSHVDIPARTCLYHCNPFDYDLTEDEVRESPVDKAVRLVQEELDQTRDRKRAILLLVELEERFDFPRAKGMRYPYEQPERSREDFWKYVEERDKAIADFVKTL